MIARRHRTLALWLVALVSCAVASWLMEGCGPTIGTTRRRYEAEVQRCQANEEAIAESCQTQAECRARLEAERSRCDAELQRICTSNRRARGVCR
jgi:hypothetical protein